MALFFLDYTYAGGGWPAPGREGHGYW